MMKTDYLVRRVSGAAAFGIAFLGSLPFTLLVAWNDAYWTIPLDVEERWTAADLLSHYTDATRNGGTAAVGIAVLTAIMCAFYNFAARWVPVRVTLETKQRTDEAAKPRAA